MADLFGVIASIGVFSSLLLSAWQARELARQTAINNGIAAASAIYNSIERLHQVDGLIAADPLIDAYFYGGRGLPSETESQARVLVIARMLADTIDYGLMITALIPDTGSYEGWRDYALEMRRSSPALVHMVNAHPSWWPALVGHWNANPEPAA
ncbi:hypothetical protein OG426_09620 [Streptomyces canus]|uniref:hypothetical protein n=1 Tax=Streptomyces canus TaxID=58343 RepID=UPI00386EAAFC|nr:hypothetical protein OG426_09620 [Streptomyces canus]